MAARKPKATKPAAAPTLGAALAAAAGPVAPAPVAPAPVAVALRGGPAVVAVTTGPAPYRVKAAHNVAWWQAIQACLQANGGTATVPVVCAAAQCPPTHLAYLLRRGHLAAVTA
jgi:hypothetical protein